MAQVLQRAKVVRLHAPLGAAHRRGGCCDVEPFKSSQQERLLLSFRQIADSLLERLHGFIDLHSLTRPEFSARRRLDWVGQLFVFVCARRQPGHHAGSDRAPALAIADPVVEDPVEERRPLRRRPRCVATRELQHRILHDVERIIDVAYRDLCDFEGATLDARQELLELARLIQNRLLRSACRLLSKQGGKSARQRNRRIRHGDTTPPGCRHERSRESTRLWVAVITSHRCVG